MPFRPLSAALAILNVPDRARITWPVHIITSGAASLHPRLLVAVVTRRRMSRIVPTTARPRPSLSRRTPSSLALSTQLSFPVFGDDGVPARYGLGDVSYPAMRGLRQLRHLVMVPVIHVDSVLDQEEREVSAFSTIIESISRL